MRLDGTRLQGLTPLTLTVEGQWLPLPKRDWRGRSTSTAPVLAMSFVTSEGDCQWSKSARKEAEIEVRVLLGHYYASGLDVQVNFGVGRSGSRSRCLVSSPTYVPVIAQRREFPCGTITSFATVDGKPAVELSVLFIARQDVKSARNGLWHLRPELAALVTDPQLHRILTYGRVGHFLL